MSEKPLQSNNTTSEQSHSRNLLLGKFPPNSTLNELQSFLTFEDSGVFRGCVLAESTLDNYARLSFLAVLLHVFQVLEL